MVQLAKLCLILCAGLQCAVGAPNFDYEYSREVDACLRLHMVPATWAEAGMRCSLEGGILASPTTSAMAEVMAAIMAKHVKHDEQQMRSVFTGINSILTRENFTSIEGVPLSSIPLGWAPGEPDNGNSDEDCVMMTGASKLADVSCNSMLPYFCRKESANKCGSKDKGYEWEPRTGSCYKFHRTANTWRKALVTCIAEGGHLAIINSDTESLVLKDIFNKNPRNSITGCNNDAVRIWQANDFAHIGFLDLDHKGEWITIHGQKLAEAGFEQWSGPQPDHKGIENCGSIYRDGLLNDIGCYNKLGYICEITP